MTQRPTPLHQPLEPSAPRHILTPAAPQPPQQLVEPLSPPSPTLPTAQPNPHASPENVEGVVSERHHQPEATPARQEVAPPSVDPGQSMIPYNQERTTPAPNQPQPNLVPAPSAGREGAGMHERNQGDHTSNSQLPIDPVQHYLPDEPLPNTDPIHVPGMP